MFKKYLKEEEYLKKSFLEEGKCKKSHVLAKKFRPCTQRRTLSYKKLIIYNRRWTIKNYLLIIDIRL